MDNTWAAGLDFRPLEHGVDVSVQALTKYASGHSDLLMGAISVREAAVGEAIQVVIEDLGWHVSPEDAWLALRGLRTLPLRYAEASRRPATVVQKPPEHIARTRGQTQEAAKCKGIGVLHRRISIREKVVGRPQSPAEAFGVVRREGSPFSG